MSAVEQAFWSRFARLPEHQRVAMREAATKALAHRAVLDQHADEFEAWVTHGSEARWNRHLLELGRTWWEYQVHRGLGAARIQNCEGPVPLAKGCDCYECSLHRLLDAERTDMPHGAAMSERHLRSLQRIGFHIHHRILEGGLTQ